MHLFSTTFPKHLFSNFGLFVLCDLLDKYSKASIIFIRIQLYIEIWSRKTFCWMIVLMWKSPTLDLPKCCQKMRNCLVSRIFLIFATIRQAVYWTIVNVNISHLFLGIIFSDLCGTPGYLAPETLKCSMWEKSPGYSNEVDM